jgi:D-alanyl-D-alanine carboxypeptidase (penicillin-binding protein 5/6)
VAEDLSLLVPVLNQGDIDAEIVYNGPIEAPISAGDQLGELVVQLEGLPEKRLPLVAQSDVLRGGFKTRLRTAALVLWDKFGPGVDAAEEGA